MRPLFGPAGNSDSFTGKGLEDVPEYVSSMGLDAYEYQCGHGVRITAERARAFGELAAQDGVALSIHAPYYISLSSEEEDKRQNSIRYILEAARAAKQMGAGRVVVHSGSCGKSPRAEALGRSGDTLRRALEAMDGEGLGEVHLCPETMGKINQLGTLGEVLELCKIDERLIPCIDFGHINARTFGSLRSLSDFEAIFDAVENELGTERLRTFHAHFSKIEYTLKGGEKQHLTFADQTYGPEFEPVAHLMARRRCCPVIICESAGTQAEDAREMKRIYQKTAEGEL